MSDFIREVDEGVRQDRARDLLARFWPAILAVLVLVLAGVGAWRANDYFATKRAQEVGGRYLDALQLSRDGKTAEALAALDGVLKDATPGYRLLARFRLAAATGRTDPAAGAKLFDDLGNDASVDPALQSLARLRAAVLLVDSEPYADLKRRLEPLADANSSLRGPARELLAIAALKAGQDQDAGRVLDAIETDPTTPPNLRQRADAMLGLVRAGPEKAAEAPTAATPPTPAATPAPQAPAPAPPPTDAPAP